QDYCVDSLSDPRSLRLDGSSSARAAGSSASRPADSTVTLDKVMPTIQTMTNETLFPVPITERIAELLCGDSSSEQIDQCARRNLDFHLTPPRVLDKQAQVPPSRRRREDTLPEQRARVVALVPWRR